MITQKKTLKKWFSNFMKPAQEHFAAWIDSYWHKSESIPMSNIEGLSLAIESTASAKQLLNHLNDTNAHRDLFDKKVDKEEGKGLSSNDFTNEHKQKLEELQPTDVSGLLPKGEYDGTGQQLKEAIDGLQTKMQQVETTLSVDDTDFDTLQEIATQVKSNKNLETLLTKKMDKEEYFEKLKRGINFIPRNIRQGVPMIVEDEKLQISSEYGDVFIKGKRIIMSASAIIINDVYLMEKITQLDTTINELREEINSLKRGNAAS